MRAADPRGPAHRRSKLNSVCASTELVDIHYVRQRDPKGLGHAVLCAAPHVGKEPFAVLLADDLIDPRDPLLARMAEVRARLGGSVVALMEVDPDAIHLYGCAAVEQQPAGGDGVRITELVEKPEPGTTPSNLAIVGRYLLDPEIFEVLRGTGPGRGGEIQLTDALRTLVRAGRPVHGVVLSGRRYDTGDRAEYLRATVRLACEREDPGPEFLAWLREFVRAEELVRDVRRRVGEGADPVPAVQRRSGNALAPAAPPPQQVRGRGQSLPSLVAGLCKDPLLRLSEAGRLLLRMLDVQGSGLRQRERIVVAVPLYRDETAAVAAAQCAQGWQELSEELRRRASAQTPA